MTSILPQQKNILKYYPSFRNSYRPKLLPKHINVYISIEPRAHTHSTTHRRKLKKPHPEKAPAHERDSAFKSSGPGMKHTSHTYLRIHTTSSSVQFSLCRGEIHAAHRLPVTHARLGRLFTSRAERFCAPGIYLGSFIFGASKARLYSLLLFKSLR